MKRLIRLVFAGALIGGVPVFGGALGAGAETVPYGRVIDYGIYGLVEPGRIQDDPSTGTGKSIRNPVIRLRDTTDRIPIRKDTYFAYQYRISRLPARPLVRLRRVLVHPEMTLPDGSRSSGSKRMIRGRVSNGEVFAHDGFALIDDYEMVAGDWIFQIWYGEELLVEQRFTTYWPEE